MINRILIFFVMLTFPTTAAFADDGGHDTRCSAVSDISACNELVAQQRVKLAENTQGKGFGPQSPRDIDSRSGRNGIIFSDAPPYAEMNLCNIHFHNGAEHKGGEFTTFMSRGDGSGYANGYQYDGDLGPQEITPIGGAICPGEGGSLAPGDTIEVHYVHTTADVAPGKGLGACLSQAAQNPQLRVEAQVFVLVNDQSALDFGSLTALSGTGKGARATGIPSDTGTPVQYAGSTTGPSYNEVGSPLQVSWSVRPRVAKVDIQSVGKWCRGNVFEESEAHGTRNLILNPDLLSEIK